MNGGALPRVLLRDAGLRVLPGLISPREGRAWLVGWQGTRGVLRSVPLPGWAPKGSDLGADIAWRHAFLAGLAARGFPSPRPLPAFDGRSWTIRRGIAWELTCYVPGRAVGWADRPSMEEIGAFLASYHAASRGIGVTGQRPIALPLADVPRVLASAPLEAAGVGAEETAQIRGLAERLACELGESAQQSTSAGRGSRRLVIHGDFTNDNVVASGTPPRPSGVIDFALAHAESPPADIGYALWRSGRPRPDADHLDLSRVRRFVGGYAGAAGLTAADADAIPAYLWGRGLQMIAKRVLAGRPETGMLAEVRWLAEHDQAVRDAVAADR